MIRTNMKKLLLIYFLFLLSCAPLNYTPNVQITPTPRNYYWDYYYYTPTIPYNYSYRWGTYGWRYTYTPPIIIQPVRPLPPRPRYQAPPRRDRLNQQYRPRTNRP